MICPHCGGSVLISRELDGFESRCLSCSRRPDEPFRQTTLPGFACAAPFCKARCATEADLALHIRMNHQDVPHTRTATAADKRTHHGILSAPANNNLYHEEFQR